MFHSIWIVYLIYSCSLSIHGTPAITDGEKNRIPMTWKYTDELTDKCPLKSNQRHLDVLPGIGWDNLVNEDRGLVIDRERYTKCRNSPDGRYVIPDDIVFEPRKSSIVDITSEVFNSSNSFTSLTANSINAAVEFGFWYKIGGDFSLEKETFRKISGSSRSVIVRNQLRHKRYTVRLLPDSKLHPRFHKRMLNIATHLRRGNVTVEFIRKFDEGNISHSGLNEQGMGSVEIASYNEAMRAFHYADLVVRDYGTHCIQSVDAGGVLVRTDTLDINTSGTAKADSLELSLAASATFARMLKFTVGGSHGTHESVSDAYTKHVVRSKVTSHGGPILGTGDMNLTKWELGLDNELVVIDRSGTPIHELITSISLPELDEDIVFRLSMTLKSAVERYFTSNVVIGCMEETSIHYDMNANVAGQCIRNGDPLLNVSNRLPAGGIFQHCLGPKQLCDSSLVRNSMNTHSSCPEGYIGRWLLSDRRFTCSRQCKTSYKWWESRECPVKCFRSEFFWCFLDPTLAVAQTVDENDGSVFENIYTIQIIDPITCLGDSWFVEPHYCVHTNRVLAGVNAMTFGGLYSCQLGNSLVEVLERNHAVNETLHIGRSNWGTPESLESHILSPKMLQRRCPNGFKAHVAVKRNNCTSRIQKGNDSKQSRSTFKIRLEFKKTMGSADP